MIASASEKIMRFLLSALMIVFFVLLALPWALFYGGILMKDYMAFART